VDFELRRDAVRGLDEACTGTPDDRRALVRELLETRADGRIKLYVTMCGLRHRREHPALYLDGAYVPLVPAGARLAHLFAFARVHEGETVLVAVPRLVGGLLGDTGRPPIGEDLWDGTWLHLPAALAPHPGGGYRHVLTGRSIEADVVDGRPVRRAAAVFADAPVALLEPA
jgi:(1->4)-alpha-D-glucan 1-alpha-D-glucosylmutase